jgi:3-hydroxyacyl-CoA dehydrogenase/enoyl-CoA hydratase/3-hydroxybutyryl-CoA epimerase
MPPLALQDEVSLSLGVHVADQTRKDLAAEGQPYEAHPGEAVLRQLCEIGRVGKKAGRGFYDWPAEGDKGDKRLWPGLKEMFPLAAEQPAQHEMIERLLYAQANEAARCLEEGVLRSVADGNVGSILGWGFAPFFGGALQFINTVGPAHFVARSRELAAAHGKRFKPAKLVIELAKKGERLEEGGPVSA